MNHRGRATAITLLLLSLSARASAQEPALWRDPSPHTVQFITVDKDVKLELLDWGGDGRPLVLLAGLGDTAHVKRAKSHRKVTSAKQSQTGPKKSSKANSSTRKSHSPR